MGTPDDAVTPYPRCAASGAVVPIVYGLPIPATFEAARRGEVRLGGCVVFPDLPAWHCQRCAVSFGRLAERWPGLG
jgi:hypothetical protein